MMDPARILSQRMVERYVAGQLSPEEIAEFEAYFLDHPELIDEIEITRRLKLGLGSLRFKGELPGLVERAAGAARNRYFAIAASVLLVAGFSAWYLAQRAGAGPPIVAASIDRFGASLRAPDALSEIMLIRSRSGEPIAIELPSTPRLYKVRIVANTGAADSDFEVMLLRKISGRAPELVQSIANVRPDADGMLTVYFDARAAGAGSYLFRTTGRDGTPSEYELTLE